MNFEWYKTLGLDDSIEQGDFIPDCPIIIPPDTIVKGDKPDVEVLLIDSIILTQSCDLANGKIDLVLVCPFYSLTYYLSHLPPDQLKGKGRQNAIDNLKKGYKPGHHLLNKHENISMLSDFQVVDFRNVYGIQINALKNTCSHLPERVRLLPPYREHLSQAFARYFMRVGLPQDLNLDDY